jgi:hypothetical protein
VVEKIPNPDEKIFRNRFTIPSSGSQSESKKRRENLKGAMILEKFSKKQKRDNISLEVGHLYIR